MPNEDERRVTVFPPGSNLPAQQPSPADGDDFDWVQSGFLARRRGHALARTIDELAGGLEIAAKYNIAAKAYEESRQALAHARDQASLLPLKLEVQRERLNAEILQGQAHFNRVLQAHRQAAEVAAADHEIDMLRREEERRRLKLCIAKLKLEKEGLRPASGPTAPAWGDGPEAFQRHFKTMQEAKRNVTEGQRRIETIYARAAAERRQLTDDELLEVDAIADAAQAAEDEVRRGGASDL